MRISILLLLAAGLLLLLLLQTTHALGSDSFLKRLETAQCALQVSVGRIPGTAMPPEWAASGAKLGFLLEMEFCPEPCADYQIMTKERLLGTRSKKAVEVLNDPSFVSAKGTEQIVVRTQGAYGVELQDLAARQYGVRFFLDFPEGAMRNDVELPAERIYFISTAWIADQPSMDRARQRQEELTQKLQDMDDEMVQIEEQSTGVLAKAMGLRQSAKLWEKRDQLQAQLEQLEQTYPLQGQLQLVEGPNDLLFAKEGVIAVKRMRGAMGTREQYHWVGTFAYDEFFEDEDDEQV
ncbi:expressed unknown protein [Seminavis robusta]|uniref:Uncharacterized protein n=1 Tax=Seminavis robusta TaxID=568900 RepID=A0A9N8DK54_9STRA|nr:expressed unknown protein [Seminavis robusta]|eukprot:Sro130_g061890.1 n/a (293) ;mRNA; r:47493-48371